MTTTHAARKRIPRDPVAAATVLCGELSLGSAIVAEQRVHAHDLHGRNRP